MLLRIVVLVLGIALCPCAANAQDGAETQADKDTKVVGGWNILGVANAGYTALHVAEAVQKDVLKQNADGTYSIDPTHIELIRNTRYMLTPSVSTGILFWHQRNDDSKCGWGIGCNVVTLSQGASIKVAPAITFHVGKFGQHVYTGFILLPEDQARFPDNKKTIIVDSGQVPNLITKQTGSGPQFYFGVSLLGAAVVSFAGK
jgi:hypothetical protein